MDHIGQRCICVAICINDCHAQHLKRPIFPQPPPQRKDHLRIEFNAPLARPQNLFRLPNNLTYAMFQEDFMYQGLRPLRLNQTLFEPKAFTFINSMYTKRLSIWTHSNDKLMSNDLVSELVQKSVISLSLSHRSLSHLPFISHAILRSCHSLDN